MIYIDNRVLIPILGPFFILGKIKLIVWLAGGEWSEPGFAVIMSCFFGWIFGIGIAAVMFETGKPIGGFWIGREKK